VRLNGEKAADQRIGLTLVFEDTGESFTLDVENAALRHRPGARGPEARLTRNTLVDLVIGQAELETAAQEGRVAGPGVGELARMLPLLDRFDFWFEIVLP
jgi:alkyl sulfatase BDS1-like metallo-beta-lactamase superfamily hydrolase